MKKVAFLCVLSIVLFAIFYLYLTSPALSDPLGWRFIPIILLGVGASWSLNEALYTFLRFYMEPFLKKRFPKWA